MRFLDCLKDVLDKQVDNALAREILLKHLAIENANAECKQIIKTLQNPTVTDMIDACQNVGTYTHQMDSSLPRVPDQPAKMLFLWENGPF